MDQSPVNGEYHERRSLVPAHLRTTRVAWIDEGLRALAAGGPDAVRVETVAAALHVTKGGFYHHFRDRQALLDAMLDTWEETLVDRAIESSDRGGGDGRTRLRRLFSAGQRERGPAGPRAVRPRLGPPQPGSRRAGASRRQPPTGLPAAVVRRVLRRPGRRGGPVPARAHAVRRRVPGERHPRSAHPTFGGRGRRPSSPALSAMSPRAQNQRRSSVTRPPSAKVPVTASAICCTSSGA